MNEINKTDQIDQINEIDQTDEPRFSPVPPVALFSLSDSHVP
jgi:hypothetical protein